MSASTNSPLTIVAEAEDEAIAVEQKRVFEISMQELLGGRFPDAWKRPELTVIASDSLQRPPTDLGRIEIDLENGGEILTHTPRDQAFLDDILESIPSPIRSSNTKRQVGSIEGVLMQAATYYGKPAVRVMERKTRRPVTCVIPDRLASVISSKATREDVWAHKKLTIRGTIHYHLNGEIQRMDVTDVQVSRISPQELPSLKDPEFTGGMSAAEYLERFRAGELG
ncbi:hypothetical protein ACSFBX_28710 [Variovorax sp. RB2P76]|uniref:hypothetical protein n=1 Tax=Variovorax sp. RB2P76 TaxID=3443736 RepID=UPI003F46B840